MSDINTENSTTDKTATRRRRRRGRGRQRTRSDEVAPLHQRSASHFQPDDQQRGANYFMQGRVQLEIDDNRARARVQGNHRPNYRVGLDWTRVPAERRLHAFCECERFAGGAPCKHLWATLLEIASSSPQSQPPGKDRIGLRKDTSASWTDLGILVDETTPEQSTQPARAPRSNRSRRGRRRNTSSKPTWQTQLDGVRAEIDRLTAPPLERPITSEPPETEVYLLINAAASDNADGLILDIFGRRQTANGKWTKLRRMTLDLSSLEGLLQGPLDDDHTDVSQLAVIGALPAKPVRPVNRNAPRGRVRHQPADPSEFQRLRIPAHLYNDILPGICERGVLRFWDGRRLGEPQTLVWDEEPPWHLTIHMEFAAAGRVRLRGVLERNGEKMALSKAPLLLLPRLGANNGHSPTESLAALLLCDDQISRLELVPARDLPWISLLRENAEVVIPEEGIEDAITALLELPMPPRLTTPEELQLTEQSAQPTPRLILEPEDAPEWMNPQLEADLRFQYGDIEVSVADPRPAFVDWESGRFVRRDTEVEHAALVRLLELGLKPTAAGAGDGLELDPRSLPMVAEPLLADGWDVEAHGITMRPPRPPSLRVQSDVDWFELSGEVDFNGDLVDLSKVLEAVARGERTIDLVDGSKGLLPAEWMDTYDSLARLAHDSSESGLRFLPSQALLVDALLVAMPPANVDRAFSELRAKLSTFERIKPKKEPRGFGGTLRSYQRLGLGWLCFLREFGLGGVLADDMGLGKTVQALALLRAYRTPTKSTGRPYLVVAPRSLIYNWLDEAARFTPSLVAAEYSGPDRESMRETLEDLDLVVTTYGTLRRDIGYLATVEFDTIILDEAQAIKNPDSQTAKAARLLTAQNRLALTGTPIENHLGELGSIFEFLNPGLLGRLPALDVLAGGRQASQQELALVAKGIRPFILRRTKAEVLPDLPEKTEQVLQCTLGPEQRELYDNLRAAYRDSLLQQVESKGIKGSTMQVLEALLRLRQVACHPGLVDESWESAGSSKIETLFEQIAGVLSEGHKLIIFSQFTKLLAYVRRELDERDAVYAYLDGQTRDRGEVVERFQTDPSCNIFLISLKAGGVGLNLTAAGYVFLLDPWWNPAVEAQAIDRTHRIGQTQPVFAYRLIARDTVEEKMLELQRSKRQLAEAILDGGGEGQTLRDLTAEDLQMLLS